MARYIKFVDALNKVVRVILVGMFIMMFLTAFLQVIIRNMTVRGITPHLDCVKFTRWETGYWQLRQLPSVQHTSQDRSSRPNHRQAGSFLSFFQIRLQIVR